MLVGSGVGSRHAGRHCHYRGRRRTGGGHQVSHQFVRSYLGVALAGSRSGTAAPDMEGHACRRACRGLRQRRSGCHGQLPAQGKATFASAPPLFGEDCLAEEFANGATSWPRAGGDLGYAKAPCRCGLSRRRGSTGRPAEPASAAPEAWPRTAPVGSQGAAERWDIKRAEQTQFGRGPQFSIAILVLDPQQRDAAVVIDRSGDPHPPTRDRIIAHFVGEALVHHGRGP